ncbi:Putative DNA helicase MCM8 [Picochlorum sp. SENEW3]|nr:Putative DNA helicase MCM8 [Picochlorum sp. SENEW3]
MWRGGRRGGYRGRGRFGRGNKNSNTQQVHEQENSPQYQGNADPISQSNGDDDDGSRRESERIFSGLLDRYWPRETIAGDDRRCDLIQSLIEFLRAPSSEKFVSDLVKIKSKSSLSSIAIPLDWKDIVLSVPNLEEAMLHAPSDAILCLRVAFHHILKSYIDEERYKKLDSVQIRLFNYYTPAHQKSVFESVGSIKADRVGKLVTLRGTVNKISPIQALYISMDFVCMRCKNTTSMRFEDGIFTPLSVCGTGYCQSRYLKANPRSAKCIDWQKIHVQPFQSDHKGGGQDAGAGAPSNLVEIELIQDLVDSCSPGDVVSITGIVKVSPSDSQGGRSRPDPKRTRLFLPYIQAVSLRRADAFNGESDASMLVAIPRNISFLPGAMPGFTAKDLSFIKAYVSRCRGRSLEVLVGSLAPDIFGLASIKAGLVLSLFGGRHGFEDADESKGSTFRVRGDIHVLLVGDPGLGKSRLLQSVSDAAPRGVYVCGPNASAAGLTLSVSKTAGEFSLEAGALVTADRGVCCVDEFDKISSEHSALLGALEQQEVSIAKAGLVASLPARTTIVAAANPVGGHYNKRLSLTQNLKLSPAMLSRFDLVFLMLDKPSEDNDKRLAGHIMKGSLSSEVSQKFTQSYDNGSDSGSQRTATRESLHARLRKGVGKKDVLPLQLVKKLVAYARQYVHPKLSEEAKKIIKDFYLKIRQRAAGDVSSPTVTHRLLESIIRISEARARVELREQVSADDALDAIEVIEETITGSLCDGPDTIIFDNANQSRKGGRTGGRFQQERDRYMRAIQRFCQKQNSKKIPVNDLFTIADGIELAIEDTRGFITYLNEMGDLLKTGTGMYQFHGKI